MTPRELIDTTRARGIALRIEGNGVKARGLRKDERSYLATPGIGRAVAALLEVDALIRDEVEQRERDAAALIERLERSYRDEQERRTRDQIASWTLDKVVALAEAGKIGADVVRIWKVERAALERRMVLTMVSRSLGASGPVSFRYTGR